MNGENTIGMSEKDVPVEKPRPTAYCQYCGEPITDEQIGEKFVGQRFLSHGCKTFDVVLYGCKSCVHVRRNWYDDGIKGAIKRHDSLAATV
jgi:hypothetical protein